MLITGRLRTEVPENIKGMIPLPTSHDLYDWDLSREPFCVPNAYYAHECPDFFQMGDWWYLVFSEFPIQAETERYYPLFQDRETQINQILEPGKLIHMDMGM